MVISRRSPVFRTIAHATREKGKKREKKVDDRIDVHGRLAHRTEVNRAGGDDRPMMADYSKTRARACPRIPISEMEGLIYYSVSRFVARGVVRLSPGTHAKLLTSLINVSTRVREPCCRARRRQAISMYHRPWCPDDQKQRLNRNK